MTETLTAADREVARLYEDYPYPAHGIVSSVVARMARPTLDALRAQQRFQRGGRLTILDAGCGTGEYGCRTNTWQERDERFKRRNGVCG